MVTGTMRAIAAPNFTKPSGYKIIDIPHPTIQKDEEIIIKVHASSVNPVDVKKANGIFKSFLPEKFPYLVGYDAAGIVSEVGPSVKNLKVGDEVYTCLPEIHRSAWAEFAKSTEEYITRKPTNMSFSEAASIPLAAITALQAFNQYKGSLDGKTVFVPAGLSGTGAYACQLAKNVFKAAKVITTVSTSKVPKVPELLGETVVDQIIDYTKEDPLKAIPAHSIDFVLDTVGQAMDFLPLMEQKDAFIVSIATLPSATTLQNAPILQGEKSPSVPFAARTFLNAADTYKRWKAKRAGVTYLYMFLEPNANDLDSLAKWSEEGKLKAVVGTAVKMNEFQKVVEALEVVFKGKGGLGKTIIEIE